MLPFSTQSRHTDSNSAPDEMRLHRQRTWSLSILPGRAPTTNIVHPAVRMFQRRAMLLHFNWPLNKMVIPRVLDWFPLQVGDVRGPQVLENVHVCSKDLLGWSVC